MGQSDHQSTGSGDCANAGVAETAPAVVHCLSATRAIKSRPVSVADRTHYGRLSSYENRVVMGGANENRNARSRRIDFDAERLGCPETVGKATGRKQSRSELRLAECDGDL